MKEHKFETNTFIGGYYIDAKLCDQIKNYFDSQINNAQSGTVLYKGQRIINKKMKDNLEISLLSNKELAVSYAKQLNKVIKQYQKNFKFVKENSLFSPKEDIKIQYYPKKAGYKKWHFERSNINNASRILVFMTYLNDVKDGGTEFYYQKTTTPAKKGLTLVWPTDWTHTHRGQISKVKDKYIVTGWFNFI